MVLMSGCSSRSTPAPVTTLELRENFYTERNRGTLAARQYQVQRGDTMYSIAFRAGLDVRTLAARNNLSEPYTIYPGQMLNLQAPVSRPQQTQPASGKPAATTSRPAVSGSPATSRPPVVTPPVPVPATRTQQQGTQNTQNNSSANTPKAVASGNQKGYVQTRPAANEKTANNTPPSGKVQWVWPVKGRIVAGFSAQQNGNKGLDIAGRDGARINAAADGQVVYAGNALRGYGNLIIIRHNDDYLSAYAHNKKILVSEKQMVKAGQEIALMGSTDASDTRLHFEIRFRGTSVDPLRYLPKQ